MVQRSAAAPNPQQLVQDQAGRTDRDRGVSNVEGREMPAGEHRAEPGPMKIKKIHHVTIQYPVNHIADGPTQDAGQGKGKQFLTGVRPQHPDDQACRQQPDGGKKPALPTACICQKTKCGTSVVRLHKIKPRRHCNRISINKCRRCPVFSKLVTNQYNQCKAIAKQGRSRKKSR